jgi:murein DD-endopeptidase MepM/ murein hydrolase activator NlpD
LVADAQTVDQLKNQISSYQSQRDKLDAEIKEIKTKLSGTQKQSSSLKAELARIEATRLALTKQINLTQVKINQSTTVIKKLSIEIVDKKNKIDSYHQYLGSALREFLRSEQESLPNILLAEDSLSSFGAELANLNSIQNKLQIGLVNLTGAKKDLEVKKVGKEAEKKSLVTLENQLADEKKIADTNKKSKDDLLTITKSKESNYQKLLADRLAKMKAVDNEISKAESSLSIVLNTKLLPAKGHGVLSYPLDKIVITQGFGYTAFSQSAAGGVYGGKGHNGVDFGTPVGSKVKAPRPGKVIGTGDTDKTCQGASYGKWILIEHDNGLSTLYGHLSLIKVSEGQSVGLGDIIAYSGNTGYSTGPHLHFTVYASQGVQVGSLKSKVAGCGTYRLPLASPNSYLNPMNYF